MNYRIYPPEEILEASVQLPVSKSYLARKMIIDTIAGNLSQTPLSEACDDLAVLYKALSGPSQGTVDVHASGTALRLLCAYYAALPGSDLLIDGNESLRRRPMAILVDALRQLGADISYEGREGFAPLRIRGCKLRGGTVSVDPTVSSQFITALMLVAPMMEDGLCLRLEGEAVSTPYIRMTAEMMRRRDALVDFERYDISISQGDYSRADNYEPELDWTAASYWYETVAFTAGWITLPGLHADDLQGDRCQTDLFTRLGVVSDFEAEDDNGLPVEGMQLSASPDLWGRLELDLSQNPDLAPALAVTAAALAVPFRLYGLQNLRHKECDRLEALRHELLKIGVIAEIESNGVILWEGKRMPVVELPVIDTHNDHRIAMAFAPLAVFVPGIVIRDVAVVEKSYPTFWEQMKQAGFNIEEVEAEG